MAWKGLADNIFICPQCDTLCRPRLSMLSHQHTGQNQNVLHTAQTASLCPASVDTSCHIRVFWRWRLLGEWDYPEHESEQLQRVLQFLQACKSLYSCFTDRVVFPLLKVNKHKTSSLFSLQFYWDFSPPVLTLTLLKTSQKKHCLWSWFDNADNCLLIIDWDQYISRKPLMVITFGHQWCKQGQIKTHGWDCIVHSESFRTSFLQWWEPR